MSCKLKHLLIQNKSFVQNHNNSSSSLIRNDLFRFNLINSRSSSSSRTRSGLNSPSSSLSRPSSCLSRTRSGLSRPSSSLSRPSSSLSRPSSSLSSTSSSLIRTSSSVTTMNLHTTTAQSSFSSSSSSFSSAAAAETPLVVTRLTDANGSIGILRLNRGKQLNALNSELCSLLVKSLKDFDSDNTIKAIVIAGGEKAFAAGGDIKGMSEIKSTEEAIEKDIFGILDEISTIRKPLIASVKGFALGGGCELAMMCDIIYASSTAEFGQPELALGTIPGIGGTQRLARMVGKSKAMECVLSCRRFSAFEAERAGLISRVVEPPDDVDDAAVELAKRIAAYPALTVQMAKECINRAFEIPLSEGLLFEKRMFHSTFSTKAREEGMKAFVEKRVPKF